MQSSTMWGREPMSVSVFKGLAGLAVEGKWPGRI